jgi:hypothetical protein
VEPPTGRNRHYRCRSVPCIFTTCFANCCQPHLLMPVTPAVVGHHTVAAAQSRIHCGSGYLTSVTALHALAGPPLLCSTPLSFEAFKFYAPLHLRSPSGCRAGAAGAAQTWMCMNPLPQGDRATASQQLPAALLFSHFTGSSEDGLHRRDDAIMACHLQRDGGGSTSAPQAAPQAVSRHAPSTACEAWSATSAPLCMWATTWRTCAPSSRPTGSGGGVTHPWLAAVDVAKDGGCTSAAPACSTSSAAAAVQPP